MSRDVRREIGELLAEQLPTVEDYICGCDPNSVAIVERTPWVHCFEWGWHDPMTPHPDAQFWPANGDGAVG